MTDRQRAFVCALAYVAHNQAFASYRGIGVKRLPEEAAMYEFKGTWNKKQLSVSDDRHNRITGKSFYSDPYGVEVLWRGGRRSGSLKIIIPKNTTRFHGRDWDRYRFEGFYHQPTTVEIRDQSQDRYSYAYRVVI